MITINVFNAGASIPVPPVGFKAPQECKLARAQARGWNDVRNRLPFRDAYDAWPPKRQLAYERGRLRAVTAIGMVGRRRLVTWNREKTFFDVACATMGSFAGAEQLIEQTSIVRKRKP